MKFVKIPKKSGGDRTIIVPGKAQKAKLRRILEDSLNYKQLQYCDKDIVHGFVPCKSIVTNAYRHVGYRYTLSFDIKDFFDSVTPAMVKDYLSEEEINNCFIDGHAYQGLPTSPAVCNLAAIKMDAAIKEALSKYFTDNNKSHYYVYTRYADDLAISYGKIDEWPEIYYDLKSLIPNIIAQHGFQVNLRKTRLQVAKFGNREVTGIYCSDTGVKVSRKLKRILRAAKHRNPSGNITQGLEEFAKCKFPCRYLPEEQIDNIHATAKFIHHKEIFAKFEKKNFNYDRIAQSDVWIGRAEKLKNTPEIKNKEFAKARVKEFLSSRLIGKETFVKVSKANTKKS